MFAIEYTEAVVEDLAHIRAFERKRLLDAIEARLTHQPTLATRNRKPIIGLSPPWEHEEPVWELRVGEHRVFYDVDELGRRVVVRAVRRKPAHKTSEEIL